MRETIYNLNYKIYFFAFIILLNFTSCLKQDNKNISNQLKFKLKQELNLPCGKLKIYKKISDEEFYKTNNDTILKSLGVESSLSNKIKINKIKNKSLNILGTLLGKFQEKMSENLNSKNGTHFSEKNQLIRMAKLLSKEIKKKKQIEFIDKLYDEKKLDNELNDIDKLIDVWQNNTLKYDNKEINKACIDLQNYFCDLHEKKYKNNPDHYISKDKLKLLKDLLQKKYIYYDEYIYKNGFKYINIDEHKLKQIVKKYNIFLPYDIDSMVNSETLIFGCGHIPKYFPYYTGYYNKLHKHPKAICIDYSVDMQPDIIGSYTNNGLYNFLYFKNFKFKKIVFEKCGNGIKCDNIKKIKLILSKNGILSMRHEDCIQLYYEHYKIKDVEPSKIKIQEFFKNIFNINIEILDYLYNSYVYDDISEKVLGLKEFNDYCKNYESSKITENNNDIRDCCRAFIEMLLIIGEAGT